MENTAVAQALESPVIGDLVFTDNAARKVKTLMEEEGNDNLMLRVFYFRWRLFGVSIRLYF